MKQLLFLVLAILAFGYAGAEKIKVVDIEDSSALPGATVFSKSGIILGLTDANGEIEISGIENYPLYVSYMGYVPETSVPFATDVVKMNHAVYQLNEVVVNPAERPVTRVLCYMREYLSGVTNKDSLIFFNEHMADFFLVDGKVKGFKEHNKPRILKSNLYCRIMNENVPDSIFCPPSRDEALTWDMLVSLPKSTLDPSKILGDNVTLSREGKYGIKEQVRLTPSTFVYQNDLLADTKDHTFSPAIFKLIGFSLDFTEILSTLVYQRNESNTYNITDLISGTTSIKVLGRGKWIKKAFNSDQPVDMYASYELYPVSIEYLTPEEAKGIYKTAPDVEMTVSPNATPLPAEIQHIVEVARKK